MILADDTSPARIGLPGWAWLRIAAMPAFFLFCALPVLLFLALNIPTGESPDEVAHVIRMESVLHRQWVGQRQMRLDSLGKEVPDGVVRANASLIFAGFSFTPGSPVAQRVMTREREAALAAYPWEPASSYLSVPNTAVYPPVLYVPGAIGMQVAKWMGQGPWVAIHWARISGALTYAGLGALSLVLARRGRGLLMATMLLPMSLWLGATCTQDGPAIGLSVLAAALLTRGSMRAWWGAAVCLAVVCMAKPLYMPLAGALVLLAPVQGWRLPLRLAGGAVAAIPGVAWYLFAQAKAGVPFVRTPAEPAGPFWTGPAGQVFATVDPKLQLQVLLHHPSLLWRLPGNLFWEHGGWLYWEAIGLLGTLDVLMPLAMYAAWGWVLGALLLGESVGRREASPWSLARLGVLGCVALTTLALCLGQYLSWTMTGAAGIAGVQGRYFLPLIAFVALGLPTLSLPRGGAVRWVLRAPLAAVGLAGLAVIPGVVVSTYYLR